MQIQDLRDFFCGYRHVLCLYVFCILGGGKTLLGVEPDTLVISKSFYEQTLHDDTFSLDKYFVKIPAELITKEDLPSAAKLLPLMEESNFPFELENNDSLGFYFIVKNETSKTKKAALYFSVDQLKIFIRSDSLQSIYSGTRIVLTKVIQSKFLYQTSHQARESAILEIPAESSIEIFIICGPKLQKKEIGSFILSNEEFYHNEFAKTKDEYIIYFWILQGIFWFMVAFSFFMYLINKDQAYLYYSFFALALAEYLILTIPTDAFLNFGNNPKLQGLIFNITAYSIPGMYGLFAIAYVHTNDYEKRLKRIIKATLYMTLLGCFGSTVYLIFTPLNAAWFSFLFWVYIPISVSFALMAVYALNIYLRSPDTLVRYFGFASLFIVAAGIVILAGNFLFGSEGNISSFPDMRLLLLFQFGGALQLLTFALCLSYRSRLIEQAKNKLETIDQAKSHFFANVSHEFRTPLTLILGPVHELLQKEREEEEAKQLSLIQRNGRRLLRFVNQILDLAKLEEGEMQLDLHSGELVSFCKRITGSFESVAASKEIELRFHSKFEELPCMFDPDKLEKVLNNLLSNACKFTPKSGRISVELALQDREMVEIKVSDNGPGIPTHHQTHIFDRFYQAKSDDFTTTQPSTGIGLALSKELVELHGGTVWVESQLDKGTVFFVTLPFEAVPGNWEDQHQEPEISSYPIIVPSEQTILTPANDGKQDLPLVLIVEDNEDVTQYVVSCLADQYQVIKAIDGQQGIDMAIQRIPDLIVTDVMMPRKDGYQLTQELKTNEKTSHIPILILTGKYSLDSRLKGLGYDADVYLTKPFEARELRAHIQTLLNNRKRMQEKFSHQVLVDEHPIDVQSLDEVFLQKCLKTVEMHMNDEEFSIEQLASELNMDRTQLFRKLKALTGKSPSRFLRTLRLAHAKSLIEAGTGTIAEIAYSVGFSSPSYFNRVFKEEFGKSPKKFRK